MCSLKTAGRQEVETFQTSRANFRLHPGEQLVHILLPGPLPGGSEADADEGEALDNPEVGQVNILLLNCTPPLSKQKHLSFPLIWVPVELVAGGVLEQTGAPLHRDELSHAADARLDVVSQAQHLVSLDHERLRPPGSPLRRAV